MHSETSKVARNTTFSLIIIIKLVFLNPFNIVDRILLKQLFYQAIFARTWPKPTIFHAIFGDHFGLGFRRIFTLNFNEIEQF